MPPVVLLNGQTDCWRRIGVWGDRSCPELAKLVHCHNCPVFATASRRFLDAPSPQGYIDDWTDRLIAPGEQAATDLQSVLIFRIGEEWLALRVQVLLEITLPRPVHRVPHRAGLLAGLVNIRGELQLCVHLGQLLGIAAEPDDAVEHGNNKGNASSSRRRLLVVRREGDAWVFPVDETDQVYRFSAAELSGPPATLARSTKRLTQGVFAWRERSIGYLDDTRLFETLRARIR
jgi:chemotaxis-related protein WspD